jgi:hypothetical protein
MASLRIASLEQLGHALVSSARFGARNSRALVERRQPAPLEPGLSGAASALPYIWAFSAQASGNRAGFSSVATGTSRLVKEMRDGCDGSFVDRVEDEDRLIRPRVGKRAPSTQALRRKSPANLALRDAKPSAAGSADPSLALHTDPSHSERVAALRFSADCDPKSYSGVLGGGRRRRRTHVRRVNMISVASNTHLGQKSPCWPPNSQTSVATTFTSAYWSSQTSAWPDRGRQGQFDQRHQASSRPEPDVAARASSR